MRMLKPVAAALILFTAAPALASPAPSSFEHEGETYVYTVETKGETRIIEGRVLSDGKRFRLAVRNGRVSGTAGGVPVAFRLSDIRRDSPADGIAMR